MYRDLNGDGKLDHDEIRSWVIPQNYDHALAEAKHLIYHVDSDNVIFTKLTKFHKINYFFFVQDGKLTKEEILDKSSVFVSSKATGYGDAIYKHVDL